jgi:hypothetical protein
MCIHNQHSSQRFCWDCNEETRLKLVKALDDDIAARDSAAAEAQILAENGFPAGTAENPVAVPDDDAPAAHSLAQFGPPIFGIASANGSFHAHYPVQEDQLNGEGLVDLGYPGSPEEGSIIEDEELVDAPVEGIPWDNLPYNPEDFSRLEVLQQQVIVDQGSTITRLKDQLQRNIEFLDALSAAFDAPVENAPVEDHPLDEERNNDDTLTYNTLIADILRLRVQLQRKVALLAALRAPVDAPVDNAPLADHPLDDERINDAIFTCNTLLSEILFDYPGLSHLNFPLRIKAAWRIALRSYRFVQEFFTVTGLNFATLPGLMVAMAGNNVFDAAAGGNANNAPIQGNQVIFRLPDCPAECPGHRADPGAAIQLPVTHAAAVQAEANYRDRAHQAQQAAGAAAAPQVLGQQAGTPRPVPAGVAGVPFGQINNLGGLAGPAGGMGFFDPPMRPGVPGMPLGMGGVMGASGPDLT